MTVCPSCRAELPFQDDAHHPYMTSSGACWAAYTELLAAQYMSAMRMRFHQLVVDAYAAQHPGTDDSRAVRSTAIHLMTLYLFVERHLDPGIGTWVHRNMIARPMFQRLALTPNLVGRRTHLHVPRSGPPGAARDAVYEWAQDVWTAWSVHHGTIRQWANSYRDIGGVDLGKK